MMLGLLLVASPSPAKARKKEGSTLTLRFMAYRDDLPPPRVWTLMTLKWGPWTERIFLALGEPFTLELSDESGPALKPPVPGLKCLRLKPPPAGLGWFAGVGPLPQGRAFSDMECSGAAVYRDTCVLKVAKEFTSPGWSASFMFVPTLPGLYSFEVRKGRIIGRFDPSFGGRASPPATCDEL